MRRRSFVGLIVLSLAGCTTNAPRATTPALPVAVSQITGTGRLAGRLEGFRAILLGALREERGIGPILDGQPSGTNQGLAVVSGTVEPVPQPGWGHEAVAPIGLVRGRFEIDGADGRPAAMLEASQGYRGGPGIEAFSDQGLEGMLDQLARLTAVGIAQRLRGEPPRVP